MFEKIIQLFKKAPEKKPIEEVNQKVVESISSVLATLPNLEQHIFLPNCYLTKEKMNFFKNKNSVENRWPLFRDLLIFIQLNLGMAALALSADLSLITDQQKIKYFAFELGMAEGLLAPAVTENKENMVSLLGFLYYYSFLIYGKNSDRVFNLFCQFIRNDEMKEERMLGSACITDKSDGGTPLTFIKAALDL